MSFRDIGSPNVKRSQQRNKTISPASKSHVRRRSSDSPSTVPPLAGIDRLRQQYDYKHNSHTGGSSRSLFNKSDPQLHNSPLRLRKQQENRPVSGIDRLRNTYANPETKSTLSYFSPNTSVNHNSSGNNNLGRMPNERPHGSPSGTMFHRISEEIHMYQKDVNDFGKVLRESRNPGMNSPQRDDWMLQKQMDTLSRRGEMIQQNLNTHEQSLQKMNRTEFYKARSSYMRLVRDFRYVCSTYQNLSQEFRRRRQYGGYNNVHGDEIRQSNSTDESDKVSRSSVHKNNNKESQRNLQIQRLQNDTENDEEYANRVMRERGAEVQEINKKMHIVNEIYKDLAGLVSSQQVQIDEVEDTIVDSHLNAKRGLNHLESVNMKSHSNKTAIQKERQNSTSDTNQWRFQSSDNETIVLDQSRYDNFSRNSNVQCGMNLPIMEKMQLVNMSELRNDIFDMGNDVMQLGKTTIRALQGQIASCAITQGTEKMRMV